ncbi:MAG TPA: hypothetical protein VEI24_06890, partial [Nitrospiria bacterium]|nr:hypothetical protein [Nitrospiria bacterium]
MSRRHLGRALWGALGLLALAGCAAFPGNRLPAIGYDQFQPGGPKPSVDYDVKFFLSYQRDPSGIYYFNKEIVKVFSRSMVFSSFEQGNGTAPRHLSLRLRDETDLALGALGGFLSGMTIGLIPARLTDTLTLQVDVKEGKRVLKHYEYQDYGVTWIELFLIVMTPTHSPSAVGREIVDNMLRHFLYDAQRDGILM